jgi:hypothetical protein
MEYAQIDDNNIFMGYVDGEPGDVEGSFVPPKDVRVVFTKPPTDELGKWRSVNDKWVEVTVAELTKIYMDLVQKRLDDFAGSEGRVYDNIMSAASYAGDDNPTFSLEGQYCKAMRSITWETAHAFMNTVLPQVVSGQRSVPTWEELEANLPELNWPDIP